MPERRRPGVDRARIQAGPQFVERPVGELHGGPEALELADRDRPRQVGQGRRGREPDAITATALARGGIGGRPEERLGSFVAAGVRGEGTADDAAVAGRRPDEAPVLGTGDEVQRVARERRGEDGIEARRDRWRRR